MRKEDLVKILSSATGFTKTDCAKVVDALPEVIREVVIREGSLRLSGLGTFKQVKRAPRMARNPQTGEKFAVPSKTTVKFKPAQVFLEELEFGG
jgi:nucleoid DNA-binding protein